MLLVPYHYTNEKKFLHKQVLKNLNLVQAVCYHITYVFQNESMLYSCLNVKELLAQNKCYIRSLGDSNGIRTHKHFVRKRTLKAKLAILNFSPNA